MKRLMPILIALPLMTGGCERKAPSNDRTAVDSAVGEAMRDWEKRTKYTTLNAEVIAKIPDGELEQAVVDYIWEVAFADRCGDEHRIISGLSKGLQMVRATWVVEGEVNNGGFHQFFWNTSGQFNRQALEGFKLIGADKHADLMARAIAIYEKEKPEQDRFKRRDTIDAFIESAKRTKLGELDDLFYAMDEDLSALRVKYIRAHPDEFTTG